MEPNLEGVPQSAHRYVLARRELLDLTSTLPADTAFWSVDASLDGEAGLAGVAAVRCTAMGLATGTEFASRVNVVRPVSNRARERRVANLELIACLAAYKLSLSEGATHTMIYNDSWMAHRFLEALQAGRNRRRYMRGARMLLDELGDDVRDMRIRVLPRRCNDAMKKADLISKQVRKGQGEFTPLLTDAVV